jgi:hypothetical protein
MAVDRAKRNDLAHCILQWMEKTASAEAIEKRASESLENDAAKNTAPDPLLRAACGWWKVRYKNWDNENMILSYGDWEELCDLVTALRSDLEGEEDRGVEPASIKQLAIFSVWTTAVVSATFFACILFGPLGLLTWAFGPIPYLFWWWLKRQARTDERGPRFVKEADHDRFLILRKQAVFPRYDPQRFRPTKAFVRARRKNVAVSVLPVVIFAAVALVLWPLQIESNLHANKRK